MILIALGRLIQFSLLLLTLRLATTLLSPAEMGKMSLVTATAAGFALLFLNPVGMFMNRRLHAWVRDGSAKIYFCYFWIYLFVVAIFSSLTLMVLVELGIWVVPIEISVLVVLVFFYLIFSTVNQVTIPGLNLLGYPTLFISLTVASTATSLIFALLFVISSTPTVEYWLSGLLVGQALLGLLGYFLLAKKLKRLNTGMHHRARLSVSKLFLLLSFAWPIAISVGFGWVQSQGYRYLMEGYLGLIYLGLFTAGYGISAGLMAGFESIFTTYFQPKFYKRITLLEDDEKFIAWQEYAQAVLPSLLLAGFLIASVAPELTKILLGPAYGDASRFIVWGAIAESARIATAVFGLIAHAKMKTKILLLPSAIGAICALVFIYVFMMAYGATGVGMGLALSSLISLGSVIYATRINLKMNSLWKQLFKSAVFGAMLLIFAEILRDTWIDDNFIYSITRLAVIGLTFLYFEYVVLGPLIRR